jgi:hypothetical protein
LRQSLHCNARLRKKPYLVQANAQLSAIGVSSN